MKVLFWVEAFLPAIGGVEVFGSHLMTALVARGHEFHVVASHPTGQAPAHEQVADGIRVSRFPFRAALQERDPRAVLGLQEAVTRLKRAVMPDLVHLNSTLPGAFFHLRTADAAPAPVLLTLHVPGMSGIGSHGLLGELLRSADQVVAVSGALFHEVAGIVPEVLPRLRVVRNAVPVPAQAPSALPWDPVTVLCLGRFSRQKGFDLAIEAFASVRQRHPDSLLMIAGDGEERGALERRTAELGLTGAVELPGWVQPDAVPEVLSRATVVLVPSRYEPFGLVALEAAQMARPVVAARVGGLVEIVADGETGVLVPPDDPRTLAEAVSSLLDEPTRADRLGAAARVRALAEFPFGGFVDAYESAYRELAG